MESQEVWKDVVGHEVSYQVSNFGRVKSISRYINDGRGNIRFIKGKIIKLQINTNKYHTVNISKDSKAKMRSVHQLVAESFLNHKPNGMETVINHIDFNKTNNYLSNLEVVSQRENTNQKHLKSSSKYVGVYEISNTKKWASVIRINGKSKHLGSFANEIEASEAYQMALINTK